MSDMKQIGGIDRRSTVASAGRGCPEATQPSRRLIGTSRALALAAIVVGSTAAWGGAREAGRVWFDANGNLTKRLSERGELFQYTYDESCRLIRIDAAAERFDVAHPEEARANVYTWTHCFERNEAGALIAETDCIGNRHALAPGAKLDVGRGTTLANHRHIAEAGK
jgi:YD repeat-containing protein